jgi:DNA-binding MarR family transcriptional regulator
MPLRNKKLTIRSTESPISFLIHRLSRSWMRASMAYYMREFGLGVPHVQILHTLGNRGALVSKEIADYTVMNKALVSRSLSDLSDRGYASSNADAADARRRVWTLTPKGKAFVDMFHGVRIGRQERLIEVLSLEEKSVLVDILERLYASSEHLRLEESKMLAARRRKKRDDSSRSRARAKSPREASDAAGL